MAKATARSQDDECVNNTTAAVTASAKLREKAYMALVRPDGVGFGNATTE